MVDVTQFSDFENLSNADQEKMRKAFASDYDINNQDPKPDDDDDEIEVVGTKEGAAAVAGSTFLGYDLQQSKREFEEAEKSGNIISLIDDEDELDSNNSSAVKGGVSEEKSKFSAKKNKIKRSRFPIDSEDDDDDDSNTAVAAATQVRSNARHVILIDDDDDDDDDEEEDNNMPSNATMSAPRISRRNHISRNAQPSRMGTRRRTSLSANLSVNRTRSRRRAALCLRHPMSHGIQQLSRRFPRAKKRRLQR